MDFLNKSPTNQRSARVAREAANHGEFLENPTSLRPRPEFVNGSYAIEDDTVLTYSIKVQNVNAVEVLLRFGADPNQTSRKGVAPISGAAHKGNVAIMKMLIEGGAAVNSTNSTGSTALIQAAHFGHLEAVQLLLKYHAASDFANQKGTTALMRASQEGHVEITKCLITSGVDVNRKNHEGMNALMLASQRGHANIVFVLVKAGAAMDEQTAQGSTALMLACKRGHEKCAEVLVSMGAEIFMRDRRMRTARDTAQRRNHINMLCWLDTQVQVTRVQEGRHKQRMQLMVMLRAAHLKNRLRFNDTLSSAFDLYNTVKRVMLHRSRSIGNSNAMLLLNTPDVVADESVLTEFTAKSSVLTVAAARQPLESLMRMELQVHLAQSSWAEIAALPVYRGGVRLAHRHDGYSEWQWPFLLQRCMAMPSGVFELIAEYLPLPRVWQWSLLRLKRRCKLAPHQAVQDLCVIMDEILRDSAIFAGSDQTNLLIKINQSPQIHSFLIDKLEMSEALLDSLCAYASAQGMLMHSSEAEVTFKYQYARNMLNTAVELFRWYRNRSNALKLLMLQPYFPVHPATGLASQQQRRADVEVGDEEGDAMESTDVAVEEEEGQEDNEEDVSDFEAEFIAAEPDTENENEMVVDEDGGDALGDSDA